MTKKHNQLAWINGEWGLSNDLGIPINDRGLNLADGIFETILILQGQPKLLDQHLERWRQSAALLDMASPPQKEWLIPLINEGINRNNLREKNGSLRLNWTRGSSFGRGININKTQTNHCFWLELNHYEPLFNPISTKISQYERRNCQSRLSYCKTFAYGQQIQARQEAKKSGHDDALLLNTRDEICCGTTSNLLVKRNGQLLTPDLTSGCLPGIMRSQGIKKGLFKEGKISPIPKKDDQWILINSLSCHAIQQIGKIKLKLFSNPDKLWASLLLE